MKIEQAKTTFKIADVESADGSTKPNLNYLKDLKDENGKALPQKILSENVARAYLIVVDGEIKKIGGSGATGGIKSTLEIYRDGGVKGRPAVRSSGAWYFLYYTTLQGKRIEFYMIYQKNSEKEMKDSSELKKVKNASTSYKFIEQCCVEDYLSIENEHSEWNVQEQGANWSPEIKNRHTQLQANVQGREKKIRRKEVRLDE